jgi:hypothetical protein
MIHDNFQRHNKMAFQMILFARSYKQRAPSLETLQPIDSSGRLVNLVADFRSM